MATEPAPSAGWAAARALGAFRIAFGLIVAGAALRTLLLGRVATHYLEPSYHFSYAGLELLGAAPPGWAYARFALLILAGLGLALGRGARAFAALIALLFSWNHLLDKSLYLNHYHLVSLLALLLAFVRSDGAYVAGRAPRPLDPRGRWLLMATFGLVWFHAGLAKLHPDWLWEGQPLGLWLAELAEGRPGEHLLAHPRTALLLSWAGLLHDLALPALLLWRRTRGLGLACALAFHLTTALLFPVGIFPYLMLAGAGLFWGWSEAPASEAEAPRPWSRLGQGAALAFLALHSLLPLRGRLGPGDLHWHEQGFRFSWRVMVLEKRGDLRYRVEGPGGQVSHVEPSGRLTPLQARMLATQPDMILQYAHALADEHQRRQGARPRVFAEAWVSLNGAPPQLLIDPERDLAGLPRDASVERYVRPRAE